MKRFLSAMLLPIMLVCSAAMADEVPPQARQHQRELTRIAHERFGLNAPVPVFAAQLHQESAWNPGAVSPVGAKGMAQFMPATAAWWCKLNRLTPTECQPSNPVWAMRSLVGYDYWLMQRVVGQTEFDQFWATLRAYNGGLGHWLHEAALTDQAFNHAAIDAACGRASRAKAHCPENLNYPDRILNRLQYRYATWGRTVSEQ